MKRSLNVRPNGSRGFSLLTVLLVITALTIVVSSAFLLSSSDALTAVARSQRALAVEAASTAVSRYQRVARPSLDSSAVVPLVQESVGTMDVDGDGIADFETRYSVENRGAEALNGSLRVEGIGEIVALPGGGVVSRAAIGSVFSTQKFTRPYENHIDNGPTAGGVLLNIPITPTTVLPE